MSCSLCGGDHGTAGCVKVPAAGTWRTGPEPALGKFVAIMVQRETPWIVITELLHKAGSFIRMPCGFVVDIRCAPEPGFNRSVPCPCGDERHWVVEVTE